MVEQTVLRFVITSSVSIINLFFKIRDANVNKLFKISRNQRESSEPRRVGAEKHDDEALVELNGRNSNLPYIDGQVRVYYTISHFVQWYLFIKNIIICFLRHDAFAPYRYLDCFMLGRFIVNGRVIEVTPHCVCYETLIWILWRYTMMRERPEFRMPCIEFLLDNRGHEAFWSGKNTGLYHSALLEYQCTSVGGRSYKLRPNRTRRAWHNLARATIIYFITLVAIGVLLMCVFLRMQLPVGLTHRGFAYNYRHCIKWITDERRAGRSPLPGTSHTSMITNYVYDSFLKKDNSKSARAHPETAQTIRDFFMPFTDLVDYTSPFHLLRMAHDCIETVIIFTVVGISFGATCYMALIMSKDIIYYCQAINDRLANLICLLRLAARGKYARPLAGRMRRNISAMRSQRTYERTSETHAETIDIQALISDLFATLDAYNKYVSLQCTCLLVFYLSYSAMVSSWIFIPGNESPKLEWYMIHLFATVYFFLMISWMSQIKTSCYKMYKLIAVAMALDENCGTSKKTWMWLMNFYTPKPLYCYTMIGATIEITRMSGLKLLVWLIGALGVASTFFQVYNIK